MKASRCRLRAALAIGVAHLVLSISPATGEITLEDMFGRRLNERGLVLVDWDGQIANPAIRIVVKPPSDASFPATALISATEPRLYFDLPGTASASGPSKSLSFASATAAASVLISVFPDRDADDEDHLVTIHFTAANGAQTTQTLAVHVIDQDRAGLPDFPVMLDFSRDQTGFFCDTVKRDLARQAAEDWAYFFTDMALSSVPANAEQTFIWNPDGFHSGSTVPNATAYTGFLLYGYGINSVSPPYRSGGEPSFSGGFQASGATTLPIKRSGGLEIEIKGNYNTLGWFLTATDDDWWKASNLGGEPNDLYSIAHHEIGHSLIFNPSHTRFGTFKTAGSVRDAQVLAYQGSAPAIDASDHLNGSIDRLSRQGAFGYEYFGDVPRRRWLITKLDLLVAQAVGYTLRPTSAFAPLAIATAALPRGTLANHYSQTLAATGGIPSYDWFILSGALPGGLGLESLAGVISGIPTATGTFTFTARLRDSDSATTPLTRAFSLTVGATPFVLTVTPNAAGLRLTFDTIAGRTYQVESRGDLGAGPWIPLGNELPGTGGAVTMTDSDFLTLERRFYRVREF